MKITLYLRYQSPFGEDVFVEGDIKSLQGKSQQGMPMEYTEDGWRITFYTEEKTFHYNYFIKVGEKIVKRESANTHLFAPLDKEYKTVVIYDHFETNPKPSRILRSAVFSKVIRRHDNQTNKKINVKVPILFNTWTTSVNYNHRLAIIGNCSAIGSWSESDAKEMYQVSYPKFQQVLDANKLTFPLEYKYVITDPAHNSIVCWEDGFNHSLSPELTPATDLVIVNDTCPNFNLPSFRGAGTAVPVFSLRTKNSFGCGEFYDIKKLADWAAKTHQRIIQTLPINDTTVYGTWKDSYPYSAISVYALHPMYLNIEGIGALKDPKQYKKIQKELNAYEFVDYEAVNRYKWEYIHEQFNQYGKETFSSEDFKTFFTENQSWLKAYAVFSYLRHKFNTSDFSQWKEDATYDQKRVDDYCQPKNKAYKDVAIHFFVQYHLHKQLFEAVQYAHTKGIALKGDIPIGVNRNSADVWEHPELFDQDGSAGAPPDYFSKTGQVWGFPIYNWNKMAEDNYAWWEQRFKKMATYFDAYRIDHILGFFRIFRTPVSAKMGLLGQFTPALPLSVEEIESFGITFDKERFTQPIINEEVLSSIFGEKKEVVKNTYLISTGDNSYKLKTQFDNHSKIDAEIGSNPELQEIKIGLYYLCCQVLFIEDYQEKGKYHPRIAIEQSYVYETLDYELRKAMKDIYEYFYFQRHNEFWKGEGIKKLTPLINSTDMMVCGEDLGMVPQCVPSVMNELEILSLEIQRMPKEMYVEFSNLNRINPQSVCTTSTHDMSTMRQWWEDERESIQRYFSNELHQYGEAPLFCEPWICQQIIENHLNSPAVWVILPLQDWMATDGNVRWSETFNERINDPGNPDNYWHYRMHIRIEDLIKNEEFNERIKNMVDKRG